MCTALETCWSETVLWTVAVQLRRFTNYPGDLSFLLTGEESQEFKQVSSEMLSHPPRAELVGCFRELLRQWYYSSFVSSRQSQSSSSVQWLFFQFDSSCKPLSTICTYISSIWNTWCFTSRCSSKRIWFGLFCCWEETQFFGTKMYKILHREVGWLWMRCKRGPLFETGEIFTEGGCNTTCLLITLLR